MTDNSITRHQTSSLLREGRGGVLGMLFLLLMAFTSCEKDYSWQPGQETPEGTPVVYFSSDNSALVPNLGEDESSFTLVLERTDTVGELTVPIVVERAVGRIDVPHSVTFPDGASRALLTIEYTYMRGMSLSLRLGSGYGNPYLEQDGSLNYVCRIARLNHLCKVNYAAASNLSQAKSNIYFYEGLNAFVFSNFMDSGIDVSFTVDVKHTGAVFDPDNMRTLYGDFVPIDNYYYDEAGDCYYLYDDKTDDYPAWTPTGWDKPVYYMLYWPYSAEYSLPYSYVDFRKGTESYFWMPTFYHDSQCLTYTTNTVYYTLDFNVSPATQE